MWGWVALVVTFVAAGLTAFNGVKAWTTPLNVSKFDTIWAIVAAAFFLLVGLTYRFRGGRFLISLVAGCIGIFYLAIILLSGSGLAFLVLIWLVVLSAALGNAFLNRFAPAIKPRTVERIILSISVGFGGFAFLTLILALLQILYSIVVYGVFIVMTLLLFPSLARSFAPFLTDRMIHLKKAWQSSDLRLESIVFSTISICLLCSLFWAVAPSIQHDPLRYHLGAPVLYVQKHGLLEISEDRSTYYAHNAEMIYTLSVALVGQPLPALLHLTFALLTAVQAFALGRSIGGTRAGIFSAILFYSLPIVTWESGTANIDLFVTFYAFSATYCVAQWWLQQEDAWLKVSGILAGLALGTKLNAALVILPLSVLLTAGLLFRTRSVGCVLRGLLRFGVPALILMAPWLLREWIWTGNPIFPFLHHTPSGDVETGRRVAVDFRLTNRWERIIRFVRLPWDLVFRPYENATPRAFMAGLPLLSLPWLYLRHSTKPFTIAWLTLLALMSYLLWFILFPISRYLLPAIPVLTILAALNLEALWQHFSLHRYSKHVKVLALIFALCYLAVTRLVSIAWGWLIPERYPYRLALGLETPSEFLSRTLPVYKAFQFLERQQGGEHQVLSIGNDFRVYTRSRVHGIRGSAQLRHFLRSFPPGQELAHKLRQIGYDFLLVDQNMTMAYPNRYQVPVIEETFLRKFTRLEFAGSSVYVYRILNEELATTSIQTGNLLTNCGFEQTNTGKDRGEWFPFGDAEFDHTGRRSRSGIVAVSVRNGGCFFQRVSILPGELYTVAHWTRTERPNQNARLQINWLDKNLKLTHVSIQLVPVSTDWLWHKMSATAPTDGAFAQIYASAHEDNEVWFDDFAFVQGSLYNERLGCRSP